MLHGCIYVIRPAALTLTSLSLRCKVKIAFSNTLHNRESFVIATKFKFKSKSEKIRRVKSQKSSALFGLVRYGSPRLSQRRHYLRTHNGIDSNNSSGCCGGNSNCSGGVACRDDKNDCCNPEMKKNNDDCCKKSSSSKKQSCCNDTSSKCNPAAATKSCCEDKGAAVKKCCDKDNDIAEEGNGGCNTDDCCASNDCCASSQSCIPVTKAPCYIANNNNCCSSSNNSASTAAKDEQQHLTCIAVIRPDNMTVDVFDVNGRSRAFRSKNKALNNKLLSSKLCFSTHGAAGDNIDGMLTYCFNGNGEHGEPDDEVCPCGEEEPHLHAHIHNPEVCSNNSENDNKGSSSSGGGGCGNAAKQNANNNWRFLSQLTLHLVDDYSDDDNLPSDGLANLPINSSMPKQCNASTLQQHLSDKGLQIPRRECCNSEEKKNECDKHRKFPVRHEDHTDYLVHNEASGQLHMEHPCVSCGDNDIHGRFRLLHTRSWVGDETLYQKKGKEKTREIRLHFFEAHPEPFHLLDVFSGLFELESSRVHAVRPVEVMERRPSSASTVELSGPQRGKSQFFVEKICCASEANQIKSLLKKHGISDVNISTTTKTVYVDHDFDLISANDVASILNAERFGAHVKQDAALQAASKIGIPTDAYVHSTFGLSKVLDGLTVDEQEKTANSIKCCLEKKFINGEIKGIEADVSEQILSIEHKPYFLTASGIVDVLDSYVYEVNIIADGGSDGLWALKLMNVGQEDAIDEHKTTVRPTVVLSGIFWIISMFSLIGGNWDYLKYVALLSVAFGLPPIAMKAYRTLRRCHFDVNCMMLLAVLGALPLQEYTESAAVCFLFSISEALESQATARARNALSAIVCLKPEHANVINPYTKAIVVLPASAVAVGSLVSVRPGDKVPCDGKVVEGESHVDESTLTGESRPVSKAEGMTVSGGTINIGNSQLEVKTTATSESSAVSRLIRLVEEAQSNRSETEKMVDTFAKIYTPFVVLAALCMCTIPWAISYDVGILWTKNALVTIVIACPCALIISTPVTYVAGLTAAAQKGVIVKGGQHLESLGRTKSIAFDKTGTLSEGVFQLLELRVIRKRSRREVLEYLALMEAPASHPLSEAIVKGAANEDVTIPKHLELKNHTLLPGEGITALVNGKEVYVGNKKLFQRLGMYDNLPKEHAVLVDEWANAGGTTGFISIVGEGIIGSYCVADKIRAESKEVLQDLKKRGIEVTMLTGDLRPAALGIGNQIGIGEEFVKSELLPEDKLTAIQNKVDASRGKDKWWKTKRAVMMVGDGVNDAPALAIADVSVAMGEGAALAMETSDVTLMDSDLRKLSWVIHMGKRVIRTIAVNIAFSLIVKGLVGGFMLAGRGSLWAAIASDVGAMLIVTLNGMRLLPSARKKNELEIANTNDERDGVVEEV